MMSDSLRVETDGAVAVLTIDRPAKHNSMTHGMWAALPEVLAGPRTTPPSGCSS